MAILEHEVRSVSDATITGLNRRLLSRQEYQKIADTGIFDGQRIELIEGEIVEMAPIGNPHAAVTHPMAVLLEAAFGPGFTARNQVPIALGSDTLPSEPQPDTAVVVGSWRDYVSRQPVASDVRLVVEVADSTLTDDRNTKAALYATAGIPEYWIVNLVDSVLEVYRKPANGKFGFIAVFKPGDHVTPLFARTSVAVSDFMP
jgi:Uma2 family endonuclease